jgi:hypothetical protein
VCVRIRVAAGVQVKIEAGNPEICEFGGESPLLPFGVSEGSPDSSVFFPEVPLMSLIEGFGRFGWRAEKNNDSAARLGVTRPRAEIALHEESEQRKNVWSDFHFSPRVLSIGLGEVQVFRRSRRWLRWIVRGLGEIEMPRPGAARSRREL